MIRREAKILLRILIIWYKMVYMGYYGIQKLLGEESISVSETLTIAEIAKRLELPESTVRYYRDRFLPYIPAVGEGRKKRYRVEALDVLGLIAQGLRSNRSAVDIENELAARFPRNVTPQDQGAGALEVLTSGAVPATGAALMVHIQKMHSVLENIADRVEQLETEKENVSDLRETIERIQERQSEETDNWAERLEDHDRKLLSQVRSMMNARQQQSLLPWWRRLLGQSS